MFASKKLTRTALSTAAFVALTAYATYASAATYEVGPTRAVKTLQDLQSKLAAGDLVLVDGDATYPGGVYLRNSGTAGSPITIRGVRVNGKRPHVAGSGAAGGPVEGLGFTVRADYVVVEGFELTGSTSACFVHKGHEVTLRDTEIHDCPSHGILAADEESGSLTIDTVEVHHSGQGDRRHQIYMATDEAMHPGAVFRMVHSWVHDGVGGNAGKSRAERNEIQYNFIEGAYYHALELIGPDADAITPAREDSEVVGNVILGNGSQKWHLVRIGGDIEEASTVGRYRFINNTFVVEGSAQSVIRVAFQAESLEFYNNVLFRSGSGTTPFFSAGGATGAPLLVAGAANFVGDGFSGLPATLSGTIAGADPGFVDVAQKNFRLQAGSILIDKGNAAPPTISGHAFPDPTATLDSAPAGAMLAPLGQAPARPTVGAPDLGAYEFGTPQATSNPGSGGASSGGSTAPGSGSSGAPGTVGAAGANGGAGGTGGAAGTYGATDGEVDGDAASSEFGSGGGCSSSPTKRTSLSGVPFFALALLLARRRQRKS